MTTASALMNTPVGGLGIPGWTGRLRRAWVDHRTYRTTLAELRGLTDDQLRDVGMRRDALRMIAREAAREI